MNTCNMWIYLFLHSASPCFSTSATKKRMQNVANISILAMFVMYLLTAIFGYLTFYGNGLEKQRVLIRWMGDLLSLINERLCFRRCGVRAAAHLQSGGPPGRPRALRAPGCAGGRHPHRSCGSFPSKDFACWSGVRVIGILLHFPLVLLISYEIELLYNGKKLLSDLRRVLKLEKGSQFEMEDSRFGLAHWSGFLFSMEWYQQLL